MGWTIDLAQRPRRAPWLAALLLGALAVACSEPGGVDAPAPSQAEDLAEAAETVAALRANANRVRVRDGRVSIVAREARRSSLLRQLAKQAGFELDAKQLPSALLSLELEDATVEAALGELLAGVDYRSEYRFDAERGAHVLVRVATEPGAPSAGSGAGAEAEDGERASARDRFRRRVELRTPEEREQARQQALLRDALAVQQLESPSPQLRAKGLEEVDVEGPGRDRVYALAASDPDPAVRALAVSRIVDDDSAAAIDALHAALRDPSPEVVREALNGVLVVGDERSVPHLQALLDASLDAETRRIAEKTLRFVE